MTAAFAQRHEAAEEVGGWGNPDMAILDGGRGEPPVMPSEMFGPLWSLITDLATGAGCPVDYVAIGMISVGASLIGAKRRVQPFLQTPQWLEPCIIWGAQVGDPSSNKSPGLDPMTNALRLLEVEYAEEHKHALQQHEAKFERAKAERARWQESVKTATKEGIATPPMPDAAVLPDVPVRRRLIVQDATPEAMGEILSGNRNGTLHLRDELAGWLNSFERYSPGGREFWLEAYGGRPHVIDRKSQKGEPLSIPFNGVSVIGGIQPEKLVEAVLNTADDGLVPRFIWAWPNPIPYRRPQHIADLARLERTFRRLLSLPSSDMGDGKAIVLLLSHEAGQIFEAWMGSNDETIKEAASLYKGFVGKLRGTVLRLSLIAELLWWAAGNERDDPTEVSPSALVAAIEFVESYAKPSALRVFGDAARPHSERNAAHLARHILKTDAQRINLREVRRTPGIAAPLRDAAAVEEAALALAEADWLKAVLPKAGAGRPSKDFLVNPAVHGGGHE